VTARGQTAVERLHTARAKTVSRDRRTEPYLGAAGHLVALRAGDLGLPQGGHDDAVALGTAFAFEGRYHLFFQFKHEGRVRHRRLRREVTRCQSTLSACASAFRGA